MTSRSHRKQPSSRSRQGVSGKRTAVMTAGFIIAIVVIWGVLDFKKQSFDAVRGGPECAIPRKSRLDPIGSGAAAACCGSLERPVGEA